MTVRFEFRFNKELRDKLIKLAKREKVSISSLVNKAVEQYLRMPERARRMK